MPTVPEQEDEEKVQLAAAIFDLQDQVCQDKVCLMREWHYADVAQNGVQLTETFF